MPNPSPSEFDQFWAAYPRRIGKLAALREWQKLQPPITEVLAALAWQVPTWHDPQYVPHPRTWLHQGRWMDEPEQPKARRCQYGHEPPCDTSQACTIKMLAEMRGQGLRAVSK